MSHAKRMRVALFGRFYPEETTAETIQAKKDTLRAEAAVRGYEIVEEFWEETTPRHTPLEERPALQRLLRSVWAQALELEGVFFADLSEFEWDTRRDHLTLTAFFEMNNLALITYEQTYYPDEWMAGWSF